MMDEEKGMIPGLEPEREAAGRRFLLAAVNGVRIYLMYDQDVMLAVALGVTMIAVIVMAKCIGCTLPLLAKKIGVDPAIMAAPLISTIMDTCTILMYFTIITVFFHL